MSKIKMMGVSPISGMIYFGTADPDKGLWLGQKTEITEMARRAVAEHLYQTGATHTYELKDGRQLVLSVEIKEKAQ